MASPFVEIEVGPRTVKVTNPDKLLFPEAGISKMQLVEYHLAVGDGILRALYERPVTLERWTTGVHEGVRHFAGLPQRVGECSDERVVIGHRGHARHLPIRSRPS